MQLGNDFTWVGNQYKISDGNKKLLYRYATLQYKL